MSNLRASFSKNDAGVVFVEIANLSNKDVYVAKARPEHIKQFPAEYAAFEAGQEQVYREGTPLTDVPGIDKNIARHYRLKNIHNAEELAALTDGACSAIGLGALTARKAAQNMLAAKRTELLEARLAQIEPRRGPGRPRKVEEGAPSPS